jgi:tetratricopeptide (TPR) repeat protein
MRGVFGCLLAAGLLLAGSGLVSCSGCGRTAPTLEQILAAYRADADYGGLTIVYPLDETIFPPEIVAPTFRWEDSTVEADAWLVTIEFADDEGRASFLTEEPAWMPAAGDWEAIKRRSRERPARVAVLGVSRAAPRKILSGARITISTSKDEVGAPIFYREVNLPFIEAVKDPSRIRWRFGSIASAAQPPIVLENLPVCGNCHSFSADGRMLGMDVDYANDKGSYAFTPVKPEVVLSPSEIITWSDYNREEDAYTFGLLSQVSPDGKFAVSTVRDRSVFVPTPDLAFSQLFFPIRGILAVYSRETGEFAALPGADDPEYVQSNPSWSPDGKQIVFARSTAYRLRRDEGKVLLTRAECAEFLDEGKPFRFDLYRVPFNDGQGGQAEPLPGASHNGRSNYFAKYSPDGRWIVFCQASSYMLLQPDSELYIMPAEGGTPRRLRCNTPRMNSWHSWSPNGKWLVFSSKANSAYTQLFLTHIDDAGISSPPVVLERFTAPDRAANIPEFVNAELTALTRIREAFLDDVSYVRAGDAFLFSGNDVAGAMREYRKALELNPQNAIAHSNLGGLLVNEGAARDGAAHLAEAIRLDPQNYSAHYNLGRLLFRQGRIDEAIERYAAAVAIKPDLADAHSTLGALLCTRRRFDEGAFHLAEALRLDPDDASTRCSLGELRMRQGRLGEALEHFQVAVRNAPRDSTARYCLGEVLARQGKTGEAIEQLALAVQIEPGYASAHRSLGKAMVQQGQLEVGLRHLSTSARLRPNDLETLLELAHALALAEQFTDAIAVAEQARRLAEAAGKEQGAAEARKRIELYQQRLADAATDAP